MTASLIDADASASDPMTTARSSAQPFFAALYAGQSGTLELRTVPLDPASAEDRRIAATYRDFVPVTNGAVDMTRVDRFLARTASRRMAAYFGVALRTPDAVQDRKGDAAHCQTLTALFVDADYKYLGEAETRRRLAQFPLSPSIVVCSGGGLHVYWRLREPIDLRTDTPKAKSLLRRVARAVVDVVDESVSEPARVLRIPGSVNFKAEYGEPRLVTLERV